MSERCPSCFGTDADYAFGAYKCSNPFHLRAKTLARQTTASVLPLREGQAEECDGGLRASVTQDPRLPKAPLFHIRLSRGGWMLARFRNANAHQLYVGPFSICIRAPWLEAPAKAHLALYASPSISSTQHSSEAK